MSTKAQFVLWLATSALLTGWLTASFEGEGRAIYLPGETSHGHYAIELACEACHTEPFADRAAMQTACERCHGGQLRESEDTHPKAKFTDPRNADRVAALDARECVTCHREHQAETTGPMGLSLPKDYCVRCHQTIGEERASHDGLSFDSCADAGCHNFHDNRALYEDFLRAHLDEPDVHEDPRVPLRTDEFDRALRDPERSDARRKRSSKTERGETPADWHESAHARAGISCAECHGTRAPDVARANARWVPHPGDQVCASCHEREREGFLASHHGMRLAVGLSPMRPALARLPMRDDAGARSLGCTTCHGAHDFDTRRAAVDACLGCHDDTHTRRFVGSPHHALWEAELSGEAAPGTGVSCATCHLAREQRGDRVVVDHDTNADLRPSEKMARPVCLSCHGLGFALDALADPALVRRNFRGRPSTHVPSLDWVERR